MCEMNRVKSNVPSWWFALVLALTAAMACLDSPQSEEETAPPAQVPLSWSQAKLSAGHQSHVAVRGLACTSCHQIARGFTNPGPEPCGECHEKKMSVAHGAHSLGAPAGPPAAPNPNIVGIDRCTSCHVFKTPQTSAGHKPTLEACKSCHKTDEKSAGPEGHVLAHTTADCLSCHKPHETPSAEAQGCATCHAGIHAEHQGLTADAAPSDEVHRAAHSCTDCHAKTHAKAALAVQSCQQCHAEREPRVPASALFGTPNHGHDACVSCHKPHAFSKQATQPCQSCHANQRALPAAGGGHARCEGCHQPHNVRVSAQRSCKGCHQALKSDHPPSSPNHSCTDCHRAHPGAKPAIAACESCHTQVSAPQSAAFIHGEGLSCVSCHKPHAFKGSVRGKVSCRGCHVDKFEATSASPTHGDCSACHGGLPHQPGPAAKDCGGCHQTQHQQVNRGHTRCLSCHDAHSGAPSRGCATCHSTERQTAPAGHQDCRSCHDAHKGSLLPDKSCSNCHQKQQTGPHGSIQGGCGNCHRPHGPMGPFKVPNCTTCHQQATLPALHKVKEHQRCSDCHTAHDRLAAGGTSDCLSCHEKQRKDHFPQTKNCRGCHLFTR